MADHTHYPAVGGGPPIAPTNERSLFMSTARTTRWLLLFALALLALTAFAACQEGDGGGETPAASLSDDQTLRVRIGGEPTTLDPQIVAFGPDLSVIKQLFRGLFYYDDADLNVVAAAATEVPTVANGGISADGLTYTIHLRDDLTWSDGEPLTAHDFEYALRRLFDPAAGATGYYFGYYTPIVGAEAAAAGQGSLDDVGVTAIDDSTLEIKLTHELPTLLTLLALWPASPLRQDVIDEHGDQWIEPGNLVGNGPYVLSEWEHEDHITVVANDNYWGDDQPTVDTIVYRMIPDEATALIAYENDELDMTVVPLPDASAFEGDPEQTKYAELTTFAWQFNNAVPPFDDDLVRKAFSAATDRETYIQSIRSGVGEAAVSWLPPGLPGYDPDRGSDYAFDPSVAADLLAEAGFPGGEGLPAVTLTIPDTQDTRLTAEFLQQQVQRNLGVDIEIEALEASTYEDRFLSGDFQVVLGAWGADYADPDSWLPQLFGTGAGLNLSQYSNAAVDQIFEQAAVELDNDTRIDLYQQAEQIIIDEDMGIAPIYHNVRNWLTKPWVDGLVETGLDAEVPGDFFFTSVQILEH
jgi:oligopeptide transport system substrate-binding protein